MTVDRVHQLEYCVTVPVSQILSELEAVTWAFQSNSIRQPRRRPCIVIPHTEGGDYLTHCPSRGGCYSLNCFLR
jgi:hypothetical protein